MIKKEQITLKNIGFFFQGNARKIADKFFNSLPIHIKEQVVFRKELVEATSPECLTAGQCKKCGCTIPDLFYADKSCDGNCYPVMMDEESWNKLKSKNIEPLILWNDPSFEEKRII